MQSLLLFPLLLWVAADDALKAKFPSADQPGGRWRYNVPRGSDDTEDDKILYTVEEPLPALTVDEVGQMLDDTKAFLIDHGCPEGMSAKEAKQLYRGCITVWMDTRTCMVALPRSEVLNEEFTRNCQESLLKNHGLWRILIAGDDKRKTHVLIYPKIVRSDLEEPGKSLAETLAAVTSREKEHEDSGAEAREKRRFEYISRLFAEKGVPAVQKDDFVILDPVFDSEKTGNREEYEDWAGKPWVVIFTLYHGSDQSALGPSNTIGFDSSGKRWVSPDGQLSLDTDQPYILRGWSIIVENDYKKRFSIKDFNTKKKKSRKVQPGEIITDKELRSSAGK